MGTILTRIQEIASKEGMTIGAMERSIGASKGVLSRAISNGTDIQSKWIQIIVENYPRYSPGWLLTGEGEMIEENHDEPAPDTVDTPLIIKELLDNIKQQAEEIGQLKEQIRQLTIEKERLAANARLSDTANAG